jgi:hypothetical protein
MAPSLRPSASSTAGRASPSPLRHAKVDFVAGHGRCTRQAHRWPLTLRSCFSLSSVVIDIPARPAPACCRLAFQAERIVDVEAEHLVAAAQADHLAAVAQVLVNRRRPALLAQPVEVGAHRLGAGQDDQVGRPAAFRPGRSSGNRLPDAGAAGRGRCGWKCADRPARRFSFLAVFCLSTVAVAIASSASSISRADRAKRRAPACRCVVPASRGRIRAGRCRRESG